MKDYPFFFSFIVICVLSRQNEASRKYIKHGGNETKYPDFKISGRDYLRDLICTVRQY
jgi:hypothetical protein